MEFILSLLIYFAFAFIGAVIHIIGKFAEEEEKNRRFNPSKWLKKNLWRTILGILLSLGGVIVLQKTGDISIAACLLMGYTGDSLLKKGQEK